MSVPVHDWRFALGALVLGAFGLFQIRGARNIARQNKIEIDCGEAARRWSYPLSGPPSTDRRHIRRTGWAMVCGAVLLLILFLVGSR